MKPTDPKEAFIRVSRTSNGGSGDTVGVTVTDPDKKRQFRLELSVEDFGNLLSTNWDVPAKVVRWNDLLSPFEASEVEPERFFEIYASTGEVMGYCRSAGLLHVLQEDHCPHVGEITEAQYDKACASDSQRPRAVSKRVFSTKIERLPVLTPTTDRKKT